ncbi:uncharacterized protein LOC141900607 [Tubulanus polymorphus]|uniref:uncharacterized protein LOC141900607 n=1 Tax=Tubulanus polymorphus TaxID=672921 RepID=UPI003DA5DA40
MNEEGDSDANVEADTSSIKCTPDESGAGDSFISSSSMAQTPHGLSHFDVPISRELLAQHSGELLLELPFSCFTNPDQNIMMGFVLHGTKVRLTTLLMEKRHLVNVMSAKPLNPTYRSRLIYSHPLDLLKKEDRSFLLELLFRLQPYIAMC